jgi:hypothetical protein
MKTVGQAVIAAKAGTGDEETVPWDPAWARFAGLYRDAWSDMHVVLMDEQLVLLSSRAGSIDTDTYLKPLGNGEFLMMAPNGGGPVGEVVRFVEEDGQVVRMITGDSFAERISP